MAKMSQRKKVRKKKNIQMAKKHVLRGSFIFYRYYRKINFTRRKDRNVNDACAISTGVKHGRMLVKFAMFA